MEENKATQRKEKKSGKEEGGTDQRGTGRRHRGRRLTPSVSQQAAAPRCGWSCPHSQRALSGVRSHLQPYTAVVYV